MTTENDFELEQIDGGKFKQWSRPTMIKRPGNITGTGAKAGQPDTTNPNFGIDGTGSYTSS